MDKFLVSSGSDFLKLSLSKSEKRLYICVSILALVAICFFASSCFFAKTTVNARIQNYNSGNSAGDYKVDVDINGGVNIINADEYIFEPGMKVSKDYYIVNNDSQAVYYGFNNVTGNLAKYILITLESDNQIIYCGSAADLSDFNLDKTYTINSGERKNFTITFEYPEAKGNASQNAELNFSVCCDYAE